MVEVIIYFCTELREFDDFEGDDETIDLRGFHVVGGLLFFNLLHTPPQPRVINSWTITQCMYVQLYVLSVYMYVQLYVHSVCMYSYMYTVYVCTVICTLCTCVCTSIAGQSHSEHNYVLL